jgi:hypothetical protein
MDRAIGDSTTSYLANYSQSSYTTPYVTNWRGSNSAMPMSKGFRSRKRVGALGGFDGFRQKQGVHTKFTQVRPPGG